MELSNKVAIVTGAAGGIGKGVALTLSKAGAKLVVSDILDLSEVSEEISSVGGDVASVKCDVTNSAAVSNLIQTALDSFGTVDILVNVAGAITLSLVENLDEKEWDLVMDVCAKGTFLTCKAVLPEMIRKKSGKIVNFSSIAGRIGYAAVAHYSASKFAVIGFSQALAQEVGKYNINVNSVCPGIVFTPMEERIYQSKHVNLLYPTIIDKLKGLSPYEMVKAVAKEANSQGRMQLPEDIADAVLFLVSDESKRITGQALNVDSGQVFS